MPRFLEWALCVVFQLSGYGGGYKSLCTLYFLLSILQFVDIGIVTSIEINHKQVDVAKKGQEVCVKIEPIPGESPKMFGRHFEATDILVSKVSISVACSQKLGQGDHFLITCISSSEVCLDPSLGCALVGPCPG